MVKWMLLAVLVFFLLVGVFLIKPLWFVPANDDMYCNSAARVYGDTIGVTGGDGTCDEVDGFEMLNCPVEMDPGSGWGASIALWKTGDNCWKGYLQVPKFVKQRIKPPGLELPPGTYIRGPELQGCVKFYKDVW